MPAFPPAPTSLERRRKEAHAAYRAAELAWEAGGRNPAAPGYVEAMARVDETLTALSLTP